MYMFCPLVCVRVWPSFGRKDLSRKLPSYTEMRSGARPVQGRTGTLFIGMATDETSDKPPPLPPKLLPAVPGEVA